MARQWWSDMVAIAAGLLIAIVFLYGTVGVMIVIHESLRQVDFDMNRLDGSAS